MKKSNNLTKFDTSLQKFNSIHLRDQEQQESWQEISRKMAEDKKRSSTPFLTFALSAVAMIGLALVALTTFQGYFNKQAENPNVIVEEDHEEEKVQENDAFLLEEPTKENIEALLMEREVARFEWTHGEESVAFVDEVENSGPVMIWHVGEKRPKVVPGLTENIGTSFIWSPDDSKVLVRSGTSIVSSGVVVDAASVENIGALTFVMGPVWSPDSEFIAFGQMDSEVTPVIATEIDGVGLSVYHVKSGGVISLIPADEENYYIPSVWEEELNYFDISFETSERVEKAIDVGFLYGENSGKEVGAPLNTYHVFAPYDIGPVHNLEEELEFSAVESTNYVVGVGTIADAAQFFHLYEINDAKDEVRLIRSSGPEPEAFMSLLEKENWVDEVATQLLETGAEKDELFFAYDASVAEELVNVNGEAMWLYPVQVGKDTFYFKRGEGLWAKHFANDRVMNLYMEEQFIYRNYLP